jgi:hypothetical protein
LKIHRFTRSSPSYSKETPTLKPDALSPSGLPWAWRSASRLTGGALAILSGFLLFGPGPAWLNKLFDGPRGTGSTLSVPGTVPAPAAFYPLTGTFLIILGLYFIVSVLISRRYVSRLFRQEQPPQLVDVHWQHEGKQPLTVTATDRENGSEYTWRVVRADTPVDNLAQAVRAFRRGTDSTQSEQAAGARAEVAELLGEPGPHKWLILRAGSTIVFPASMAEPVVGTDQPPILPASYRTILAAHRRLISAYTAALERADSLPLFVRPPVPYGSIPSHYYIRTLLCLRPLVRLHVAWHIRRQLRHLSRAYIRSKLLIPEVTEAADEERSGLTELRGECQLLISSLVDTRRRATSFLVSLFAAVPALAVVLQIHQVQPSVMLEEVTLWLFRILLIMPGLLGLLAYTDAFRCKRALFASSPALEKSLHGTRESIYKLESELFFQLGQRKLPERISDFWAYALILAAWIIFATAEPYSRDDSRTDWATLSIFILALMAVLVTTLMRRLREDR